MASTTKVPRGRPPAPAFARVAPGWLVGPMMLAATVCAAFLVLRGPDRAFTAALAALLVTALVWILISVFWPARPDRTCPACLGVTLRRLDRRSTLGIVCGACGHEDADTSSFLLAEDEDGPIEPIVIAGRAGVINERAGGRGRAR